MDWTSLSPRRSLVLPFAVIAFPLLNLVRNSLPTAREELAATVLATHVGYTLLALSIAYVGGMIILSLIKTNDIQHSYLEPLLHPSNRTLGMFALMSIATGGYLAVTPLFVETPQWVELVVTPLLFLCGLPLLFAFIGTAALANAGIQIVTTSPVDLAIASIALSVTALWMFVLAAEVTAIVRGGSAYIDLSLSKS